MEIIKDSAANAWKEVLTLIMTDGDLQETQERPILDMNNIIITITDPTDQITKPIELLKDLKEIIYPELDELEDVIFRKESSSTYYYTYGARIFNYANSKNQVDEYIIPLLKKDPSSRRAIIMLYQPTLDSKISNPESPCLISIYFRIIRGRLNATATIRSNEMFLGWPANLYQVWLLQKKIAQELGLDTGELTTISNSAHIYKKYLDEIKETIRKI